jgi:hypothetical protein
MLLKMKELGLTKGRYGYLLKKPQKGPCQKMEGRQGQVVVDVRFFQRQCQMFGECIRVMLTLYYFSNPLHM